MPKYKRGILLALSALVSYVITSLSKTGETASVQNIGTILDTTKGTELIDEFRKTLVPSAATTSFLQSFSASQHALDEIPATIQYPYQVVTPQQFTEEMSKAITEYNDVFQQVKTTSPIKWKTTIQVLQEATQISRIWNLLAYEKSVRSTPEIKKVYSTFLPIMTKQSVEIYQDNELYNVYFTLSKDPNLTVEQRAIIKKEILNFQRNGVHLSEGTREQLKNIKVELNNLQTQFGRNIMEATEYSTYHVPAVQEHLLVGIPKTLLDAASNKAKANGVDGWIFGTDQATLTSILQTAQNRTLRENLFKTYSKVATDQIEDKKWDNTPIIKDILAKRTQIAELLGFKNYLEYALQDKMIPDTATLQEKLTELADALRPETERVALDLSKMAETDGVRVLEPWDVAYYEEKLRSSQYNISQEETRKYFDVEKVLHGMFNLAKDLYDIDIVEEALDNSDKWDPMVRKFTILDATHQIKGQFYMDLYERKDKYQGAWMSQLVSRMQLAEYVQTPVAFLTCNFLQREDQPNSMAHSDVITLFHEFGHTLHHTLSTVNYATISGVNGVPIDAVELPSTFMEHWSWDKDILQAISPGMPDATIEQLIASRKLSTVLKLASNIRFAFFDMRIHKNDPSDATLSVEEIFSDSSILKCAPLEYNYVNRFPHSFQYGHYAASFYTYIWANVLASNVFMQFKSAESKREVGTRFLQTILANGASQPAMDLFVQFSGHTPQIEPFLKTFGLETSSIKPKS